MIEPDQSSGVPVARVRGFHRDVAVELNDLAVLEYGHVISDRTWYPLETQSTTEIREIVGQFGSRGGGPLSLRDFLDLKRIAVAGGPVQDLFAERALPALAFLPPPGGKPTGVVGTLYPYQTDGWRWLQFIWDQGLGGLLGDQMGLGKTLQIISLIADSSKQRKTPALVVAPGSLLENWIREFKKFAPDIKTLKHRGPERTGRPDALREFDVVVTSYDTVIRDNSLLLMIPWSVVVIDEAQFIKNPDATRTRCVKKLPRDVGVAVTGTPVENRLSDLWSIMDFVLPGYLGTLEEFRKSYDDSLHDAARLEPAVSPLILRRLVADVAQDLPERIDIPQALELETSEAESYDRLRQDILAQYGASATLVSITKLRMFCAHPSLALDTSMGDPATFAKYSRLCELLEEIFAQNEKAILFTSYTEMADIIGQDISQRFGVFTGCIDGRLPIDDRQPLIDTFSEKIGPALLVLNPPRRRRRTQYHGGQSRYSL